jgi:hypothetical protein
MYKYSQSTGTLTQDGKFIATGYSGFQDGKNNPALQNVPNVGPIPQGLYRIGSARDTATHGPVVMPLTPEEGTETFGRSGFLIHGDSLLHPGGASHGCIILRRDIRETIAASGDTQLTVTA